MGGPSYRPRICFVVVQKSHNTRFFPTSAESTHKSGNVLPGTAVDRGVTDPHAFDFFLNSHAGIQGTNRAPRWAVPGGCGRVWLMRLRLGLNPHHMAMAL